MRVSGIGRKFDQLKDNIRCLKVIRLLLDALFPYLALCILRYLFAYGCMFLSQERNAILFCWVRGFVAAAVKDFGM